MREYTKPTVCLYGTLDDFIHGIPTGGFYHDLYALTCDKFAPIIAVDCNTASDMECKYFAGKGILVDQPAFVPCPNL